MDVLEKSTSPISVQKPTLSAWKLELLFWVLQADPMGRGILGRMGCGPSHRGWNAHPPLLCTPPQSVCVARQRRPHPYRGRDSKGNFILLFAIPTGRKEWETKLPPPVPGPGRPDEGITTYGWELPCGSENWTWVSACNHWAICPALKMNLLEQF